MQIDTGEDSPYASAYRDAEVSARYAEETVNADFRVGLAEGHARGRVEVTLRGNTVDDYPLGGELDLAVPDITFLNALSTELNATAGSAAAKLRLQGSVGAPRVSGAAELVQGKLLIPDLGLELTDLGLRAQGNGTERLALSGTARSGQGVVSLQGEVRLDPQAHWPFQLDIEGREFGVARLPEAYVTADPALKLSGDTRRVELKGNVGIPTARIEVKQLPESAVRVSDDQVIVGEGGAASPAERGAGKTALVVDVTVKLGDAVRFQGLGLATTLGGNLRLRSLPAGDIVGDGVLKLKKGTYEGYGQKLVIKQGRLLFAGPLDDPALDIRATRTSGDVVAGILITGTLRSPLAQVYSDPVMSEAEAMSYLLTGKPLLVHRQHRVAGDRRRRGTRRQQPPLEADHRDARRGSRCRVRRRGRRERGQRRQATHPAAPRGLPLRPLQRGLDAEVHLRAFAPFQPDRRIGPGAGDRSQRHHGQGMTAPPQWPRRTNPLSELLIAARIGWERRPRRGRMHPWTSTSASRGSSAIWMSTTPSNPTWRGSRTSPV